MLCRNHPQSRKRCARGFVPRQSIIADVGASRQKSHLLCVETDAVIGAAAHSMLGACRKSADSPPTAMDRSRGSNFWCLRVSSTKTQKRTRNGWPPLALRPNKLHGQPDQVRQIL